MGKEKLNEDYYSMDENEKFAMRYGAEGRHLSDVIRDNPEKITSPDKMLDAWDMGMNMRKNGTSKVFLDDIEKTERDNLLASTNPKTDGNGITAEPVRDMWGNDLSESSSFGNSEDSSIPPKELKLDFGEDENYTPKGENYLLQPKEKYDKMYLTNYSNEATLGKTEEGKYKFSIKPEDIFKAIGWLCTGFGLLKGAAPSGIDLAEQNLLSQEEEDELPEFHYTMGSDDIYRALDDWNREQLYGE